MNKSLDIYLNDDFVGELIQDRYGNLEFIYDDSYIEGTNRSISVSLPKKEKHFKDHRIKAFFSGLLPDDILRQKLAKYLGVSDKNAFSLLKEVGGECAGALSFYPHGEPKETLLGEEEELDEHKLKEVITLLRKRPLLAGEGGLRLSLAGAQDKLAVGFKGGKITLCKGATPTTHILKPMIESIQDSVHNEFFCMRLAREIGINVPSVEMIQMENSQCFLVERYDRIKDENNVVHRLHQEDFCQAMGVLPELKYEREGGPNIKKCQDLIENVSLRPADDSLNFLERVIFNYLIGNSDAHGKNFSLLYRHEKPELAPAYDLLSTAVYSELSLKMAMKIGGKYDPSEVAFRHWACIVPETKLASNHLKKLINKISKKLLDQAHILNTDLKKQGITSSIFERIIGTIQKRSIRIHS
jgi:serine/threonine-protein kinase HipA